MQQDKSFSQPFTHDFTNKKADMLLILSKVFRKAIMQIYILTCSSNRVSICGTNGYNNTKEGIVQGVKWAECTDGKNRMPNTSTYSMINITHILPKSMKEWQKSHEKYHPRCQPQLGHKTMVHENPGNQLYSSTACNNKITNVLWLLMDMHFEEHLYRKLTPHNYNLTYSSK